MKILVTSVLSDKLHIIWTTLVLLAIFKKHKNRKFFPASFPGHEKNPQYCLKRIDFWCIKEKEHKARGNINMQI